MNILLYVLMAVGGTVGIAATLYLTVAIPVVLVWKLYRKIKHHNSLFD